MVNVCGGDVRAMKARGAESLRKETEAGPMGKGMWHPFLLGGVVTTVEMTTRKSLAWS